MLHSPNSRASSPIFRWMLLCALSWCGLASASDPFSTENDHQANPVLHANGHGNHAAPDKVARHARFLPLDRPSQVGGGANESLREFDVQLPCPDSLPEHALNLPEVVNFALCNNPQTREVWANSRAQAAQVGVVQAGYLPNLGVNLSESQSTPGNRQRSAGLSLSYLLYDFGARAAHLESARHTLLALNATEDGTVQSLFLAAVQAYYQIQATRAALDAADVSEQAAQQSFKVADARYRAGSATPADKLSAQTAWSQTTLNRITAQGALKIAQGNLANLLGLDANTSVRLVAPLASLIPPPRQGEVWDGEGVKLPDELAVLKDFEQNVAALIEQARQSRPDLQAAQATLKAAQANADAARAAGKPSLALTAAANQNNSAGINTNSSTLGLNLSVPLFSGYAPTYRIRAALALVETRKAQLERIRLQVALDVWTAWQNLTTATETLRTTADLLGSAAQSERVARGRYQAGAGIMLDVLNAQTTLAAARQQRIQAELNWNVSRAALAQAMGHLDAGMLRTDNNEPR